MAKNTIRARTEKTAATEEELRASLEEAYPDHKVAEILDLGNEWEGVLEKDFEHEAAFPPEKGDNDSDPGGEPKPKAKKPKEKSDGESKSDFGDSDSKSDDESGDLGEGSSEEEGEDSDGPEDFGGKPGNGEDPLKSIHHLLSELTQKVKELEQKAGLVDDIHQKIKPHIQESPTDIGPTAPGGANPMGGPPPGGGGPGGAPPGLGRPSPGMGGPGGGGQMGPPPIPRRPQPAKGFDRRIRDPQRGLPSAFTNVNTKYVFIPIQANDTEYTISDAVEAIKGDNKYSNYRIAGIQENLRENRYIIRLQK